MYCDKGIQQLAFKNVTHLLYLFVILFYLFITSLYIDEPTTPILAWAIIYLCKSNLMICIPYMWNSQQFTGNVSFFITSPYNIKGTLHQSTHRRHCPPLRPSLL